MRLFLRKPLQRCAWAGSEPEGANGRLGAQAGLASYAKAKAGKSHRKGSEQQRGIALITVLLGLMVVSALALGMYFSSANETSVNYNYRDAEIAQYAAMAGIQEARERLILSAADAIAAPTALPGGAGTVIYITNPKNGETVTPTDSSNAFFDDELCHENFAGLSLTNSGANVPCGAGAPTSAVTSIASDSPDTNTAAAMAYKWVRITQKSNKSASPDGSAGAFVSGDSSTDNTIPVCWDSNSGRERLRPTAGVASTLAGNAANARATCDSDPPVGATIGAMHSVYMVTSYAVARGGSQRLVQAEVGLDVLPSLNSAVESNDNVILNGALTVNGYDNCSCKCTVSGTGNNKVMTCSNLTTSNGGNSNHTCDNSKFGIYASGSIQNPTGANEAVYAGTSPTYEGSNTTPAAGPFPYNVSSLVTQYSQFPGVVNVTGSPYNWSCPSANCGTQGGGTGGTLGAATFPPSPPDNPSGMTPQLTYVPGNVHLSGPWTGSGILIVNGDLTIDGGLQFYGLLLVSGTVKFAGGGSAPTNIYGGVLSGTPVVDDTVLGGSVDVQYDFCALKNSLKNQMPRTIVTRELTY
jgi:hypothetical protein